MSRNKKDKKLKKKEKLQEAVKEDKIKYDIIWLLQSERQDSKPNLGKFLNSYVKEIRGCTDGKILLYPKCQYKISKIIIRFLDGHELLYIRNGIEGSEYYLYDELDEIPLKDKDKDIIKQFFDYLE